MTGISPRLLLLLPLLLVLVTYTHQVQGQSFGTFIGAIGSSFSSIVSDQEEPKPLKVTEGQGYEERQYPSANWACKTHNGTYTSDRQSSIFLSLFSYLSEENDQKASIAMSIPVSVEYKVSPTGDKFYSACFYLENKFQANPPIPTDKSISIVKREPLNIFTRKFGGYANEEAEWLKEAKDLKPIVEAGGHKVKEDVMYWNAYDSPVRFWGRRNEVWLVKSVV